MTILGIDLSSKILHGCILDVDEPPVLRVETIGSDTDPLIERLRRVPYAVHSLTLPAFGAIVPEWVVIEDAFTRGKNTALARTIGAIIASVPQDSQVAVISSGDWRRALGAVNTKEAGHAAVHVAMGTVRPGVLYATNALDEHELDAIGIALAWQRILASQATP